MISFIMNYKHGMRNTRIYSIYHGLRQRCDNPKVVDYHIWGGKGIKYQWKTFEEFYKDMGTSYEEHVKKFGIKDTTIDRIDNNKNYTKENCHWTTVKEQVHNSGIIKPLTFKNETKSQIEWCRELGIKPTTLNMRIKKYGWSVEKALSIKSK